MDLLEYCTQNWKGISAAGAAMAGIFTAANHAVTIAKNIGDMRRATRTELRELEKKQEEKREAEKREAESREGEGKEPSRLVQPTPAELDHLVKFHKHLPSEGLLLQRRTSRTITINLLSILLVTGVLISLIISPPNSDKEQALTARIEGLEQQVAQAKSEAEKASKTAEDNRTKFENYVTNQSSPESPGLQNSFSPYYNTVAAAAQWAKFTSALSLKRPHFVYRAGDEGPVKDLVGDDLMLGLESRLGRRYEPFYTPEQPIILNDPSYHDVIPQLGIQF